MDTGSSAQDGLFDESLVERVEQPADVPMDANGGINKRFKAFEPDAVMLVPPSLEEWLPQVIWPGSLASSWTGSWI